MNRQQRRAMSVINRKEENNIIMTQDSDRLQRYAETVKNKMFLVGDVRKFRGVEADWAHFEFLMHSMGWDSKDKLAILEGRMTYLEFIQVFWLHLWPYVENLTTNYEKFVDQFNMLLDDQDEVLKNYADQNLELRIYKDFEQTLPKEILSKFKEYKKEKTKEIEDKIKEIQAEESNANARKN